MSEASGVAPSATAFIVGAELAAGHDGQAEMALRIQYANGVVGSVMLDAETGFALMRNCDVDSLGGLKGQPWRNILKGV